MVERAEHRPEGFEKGPTLFLKESDRPLIEQIKSELVESHLTSVDSFKISDTDNPEFIAVETPKRRSDLFFEIYYKGARILQSYRGVEAKNKLKEAIKKRIEEALEETQSWQPSFPLQNRRNGT